MKRCFVKRSPFLVLALSVCALIGLAACSPKQGPVVNVQDLQLLQERIDPLHPGRGVTDYPGNTLEDVPKSYAMVLLGELERKKHRGTTGFPELGALAGQWLLDHADENQDGVIGWGVPVAWDAYGDGSINPIHTEYSISTAIVLDALLSWREVVSGTKADEILSMAERAAMPYLNRDVWSPAGMLPYSLLESDRRYDTFNSAMYLAGQFQRLSNLTNDRQLAERLRKAADSTVAALLLHKQVSPETGALYWNYSVSEASPNDLPHASYIVQGLADYVRYGGQLSGEIKLDSVFEHLTEFIPVASSDNTGGAVVRAWPRFRNEITLEARSYDLGMALHLACTYDRLAPLRRILFNAVSDYRNQKGEYQKYPIRSSHQPLVVAEYESYLYRGLSTCLVATASAGDLRPQPLVQRPGVSTERTEAVASALRPKPENDEVEVPFVHLLRGGERAGVLYAPRTMQARLIFSDGKVVSLQQPGLPLAFMDAGEKSAVVMRGLPEGDLWLVSASGNPLLRIRHETNREPIFRVASLHQGVIYLVYYDNPSSANWLIRLEHGQLGWQLSGVPVKLPSLQDPAGATYEMIPRMEFVATGKKLWITGGTLRAEIDAEGNVVEGRFDRCLRSVEVIASPDGPLALCANADLAGSAWVFSGPGTQSEPDLTKGIPWNLRMVGSTPVVDYASAPEELTAMLVRDLQRTQQSGWMEFGVNNEEGRIPWSQIYYLNGFLDMIALARANERAADVFLPILPSIRQRLDLEMALIDLHWREGLYRTRAFTVDRSPALFAVQTARLLLLMQRYATEVPDAKPLAGYADVIDSVTSLRGHIEVLALSGERAQWITKGRPHLRWPKGSQFYFDGLNVPFNHQNEWAYAVLRAGAAKSPNIAHAQDVIRYFGEQIAPEGPLPADGVWNYWWGRAFDGWTEADKVSANKPTYSGDKIKAWISFRTIDAMAMVSAYGAFSDPGRERMVESVRGLVQEGKLYPFAAYELLRLNMLVLPSRPVAQSYARVGAPWELQSAPWALTRLAEKP